MEDRLDLVRDLLDKKIVDRGGREMGRVDGVILETHASAPLAVAAVELAAWTLFRRVFPLLGTVPARARRIPFAQVLDIADHVHVDRAGDEALITGTELRLEDLLGREVLAGNNRAVGRLEEFRAERRGEACVITGFVIGAAGLLERLGLGARMLVGARMDARMARWDQIDLSHPAHPRLTCALDALETI